VRPDDSPGQRPGIWSNKERIAPNGATFANVHGRRFHGPNVG